MRRPCWRAATAGSVFWYARLAFGETAVVQRIRSVLNYMLYRDTQGLYGEKGTVHMFNPKSAELNIFTGLALRRLPTFWMVKP